jgi:hypothetical protein
LLRRVGRVQMILGSPDSTSADAEYRQAGRAGPV